MQPTKTICKCIIFANINKRKYNLYFKTYKMGIIINKVERGGGRRIVLYKYMFFTSNLIIIVHISAYWMDGSGRAARSLQMMLMMILLKLLPLLSGQRCCCCYSRKPQNNKCTENRNSYCKTQCLNYMLCLPACLPTHINKTKPQYYNNNTSENRGRVDMAGQLLEYILWQHGMYGMIWNGMKIVVQRRGETSDNKIDKTQKGG